MPEGKAIITVAGNMGVGKTELTKLLAERMGWQPFFEEHEDNPYLADFYKDMKRWSFHSQLFFLSRRLRLYREMMEHPKGTIIQDRGVYEDAEVFARNLFEQGSMDRRDFTLYQELYKETMELMPMPGFVVYLKATVPTLMKRIQSRGREFEKDVPREYLEQLNTLYNRWIDSFTLCPVVTIGVDELDFVNTRDDQKRIVGEVVKALEGWRQEQLSFK